MPVNDTSKLENQLCFPLYAASRLAMRLYRPFLDELDLTYTQYIAMAVLWEAERISVKDLGAKLYLDSGTLTPVLKSLEKKGFLQRYRSSEDERVLIAELTDKGRALRASAEQIPGKVADCISGRALFNPAEAEKLHELLYVALEILRSAEA